MAHAYTISNPVEAHIYSFEAFCLASVIRNTNSTRIVANEGGGVLWVTNI
jgi:hypothetical protein